jgi:hypothetical protein
MIKAQCLDQGDYGVLCEFIHQTQKKAVGNSADNVTQIEILGGGLHVKYPAEKRPIMRGVHKRVCAHGFIPRIERKYVKGVYAPIFTFQFTVLQEFEGIYHDTAASVHENEQETWVAILEQAGSAPYSPTFPKEQTATNSKPQSAPSLTPGQLPTAEDLKKAGF